MKLSYRPPMLSMSLMTLAVLAACSTTPATNSRLEEARLSYRAAQDSNTGQLASAELRQAADALALADAAFERRQSTDEVNQLAYLAQQRVTVAQQVAQRKTAEQAVTEATAARDQVRLDARTRQADAAELNAEAAQRRAGDAQRRAAASQQDAQAAQRQAEASQRQSQLSMQQSAQSQQQARDAEARSQQLEAQLQAMDAKKTDRGMVITIGDVLFDTNRATLKPDTTRSLERLVGFLKQYPERKAMVEGFTDSVGGDASNLELSGRRANAVRMALVEQGVGAERLSMQGHGERYPVASNDSVDGRQLNRRVEILLSDERGQLMQR